MRQKFTAAAETGRISTGPMQTAVGDRHGQFVLYCPNGQQLNVIVSCAEIAREIAIEDGLDPIKWAWDHVSVHVAGRKTTPTWEQMCFVKNQFWDEHECVIQFHPRTKDYVNIHTGVLHLWKWFYDCGGQAMPPLEMV